MKKTTWVHIKNKKKKRKGQHAKSKMSFNKGSANYVKRNKGQGR